MTLAWQSTSARASLVIGFLIGSSITLVVSLVCQNVKRNKRDHDDDTEEQSPSSSSSLLLSRHRHDSSSSSSSIPSHIRDEQLSRHTLFFGPENMSRITQSRICIVGLGGVGSHTAIMLARAGCRHLRLIDFDQVTLSSLNRHACATLEDVGIPKVHCVRNYMRKLCPDQNLLRVDAIVQMYTTKEEENKGLLDDIISSEDDNDNDNNNNNGESWDMVVDAIDDIPTKAALLSYCLHHKIPVVSCMGAGGKADVTRLHISDLQSAAKDPLATKLRQTMKKLLPSDQTEYLEDTNQLSILYSSEKTVVKLADMTAEQYEQGIHQFGAVDNMRVRVIPVLGTMPAIMGQALAAMVLTRLGNQQIHPVPGERVGRSVRHRVFQHLKTREDKLKKQVCAAAAAANDVTTTNSSGSNGKDDDDNEGVIINNTWVGRPQIDMDDVEYLLEVWKNRCAVTGARLGTVLELVRWDLAGPSTCDNLVLMSAHAMKRFDETGREGIPEVTRKRIENRLASVYTYS